jgi:hypothetical protein
MITTLAVVIYVCVGFIVGFSVMMPDGNPRARWALLIMALWPLYLIGVACGVWE